MKPSTDLDSIAPVASESFHVVLLLQCGWAWQAGSRAGPRAM
jgi:hypothetical protein